MTDGQECPSYDARARRGCLTTEDPKTNSRAEFIGGQSREILAYVMLTRSGTARTESGTLKRIQTLVTQGRMKSDRLILSVLTLALLLGPLVPAVQCLAGGAATQGQAPIDEPLEETDEEENRVEFDDDFGSWVSVPGTRLIAPLTQCLSEDFARRDSVWSPAAGHTRAPPNC